MDIRYTAVSPIRPGPTSSDTGVPVVRAAAGASPAADSARVLAGFPPPVPVTTSYLPSSWQAGRASGKERVADVLAQQGYSAARRMIQD